MKRLTRALGAVVVAGALCTGSLFGASAAFADEEVPAPATEQVAEDAPQAPADDAVEPADTTEQAPADETVPAETDVAPAPAEAQKPAPEAQPQTTPAETVQTDDFPDYEACATWETISLGVTWPQTTLSKECGFVPEQRCEPYTVQFDKYWIRDAEDLAYFNSLTGLNSSADDQSLEPHGYSVYDVAAKDCTPVVIPANPGATVVVSCWTADFTLTNMTTGDQTGSYVSYVDGTFHEAYTVLANGTLKVHFQLHPGVGAHTITLRSGPAQGDILLATATIKNDCPVVVPPVEPPVVNPPTDTPEATPTPTPVPAPVAAVGLAATGGDVPVGGIVFASLLLLAAAGSLIYARRKANASAE